MRQCASGRGAQEPTGSLPTPGYPSTTLIAAKQRVSMRSIGQAAFVPSMFRGSWFMWTGHARKDTIPKIRNKYSPEKELRDLSPIFHIYVSVSDF